MTRHRKARLQVEVISADHQKQARCRLVHRAAVYDVDKVDVIVDTPNSGWHFGEPDHAGQRQGVPRVRCRRRPISQARRGSPNTVHWTYDTWMLANGNRPAES